jgi:hypothetical protein
MLDNRTDAGPKPTRQFVINDNNESKNKKLSGGNTHPCKEAGFSINNFATKGGIAFSEFKGIIENV